MNRIYWLALALFTLAFCADASAQRNKTIKAYLDHKVFYHPEIGSFAEVHLQFAGYSMTYIPIEGGLRSELAIQYVFKDAADKVVKTDAYRLQSPVMRDSIIEDFYEIKRILLAPGSYVLELTITDILNEKATPITAIQNIEIEDLSIKAGLSDLELAEAMYKTDTVTVFTKAGYDIIPRISNYYSAETMNLPVYLEIYHPKIAGDSSQMVGLKQSIRNVKTKEELENYTRYSKHEVNQIQPLIRLVDISKLETGEYELEYTLIDKNSVELATSSYYFDRFNDQEQEISTAADIVLNPTFQASVTNDSLSYYVESLIPISRPAEVKNIIRLLKTKDEDLYRKYLQSYWVSTAGNGELAFEGWMRYKRQIQIVQRLFGNNFMEGFETDRGRVYLQYGPPNNIITRENSPSEYPYEIWRYDKIKNFSNKRFIFYNPDLVNNGYRLLHSDLIGEVQNYRWQQQLSKRSSVNKDIDNPNAGNPRHFGGNSLELYNQY